MKWLTALVVVLGVASLGTAIYVVLANRDPAPADMRACLREQRVDLARSSESLTAVRADASVGALRVVRRWDWGRTSGVLLAGPRRDATLLALWNENTPSLAGADAGRRIYETPGRFPVVAVQAGGGARLLRCAEQLG